MIKKCLFPAAGYGTRFLPITKTIPKEMLPIVDKPLIQYAVEEAMEAGCEVMAIVTGRNKRSLEDYFDTSYEIEHQIQGTNKENALKSIRNIIEKCCFSYVRQKQMKGLGHAILTGEALIGNESFAVILADDLCISHDHPSVLKQMTSLYQKYQCSIVAIEEVALEEVSKYGVIRGELLEEGVYEIKDMVEKPSQEDAPSNLAVIGRYILTPDIFDILRETKPGKNNEIQITDALRTQAKRKRIIAYQFKGKRYDCGSVEGYIEASNAYYKKRL
ncbi:UTP--glucose-1-phosphate uridylyltransferase [Helicobacter pylori]|uniref:UTP--glucose-1-phosphate uridylyltransferase GalU n=1 Tax=Helicobacter pylori TaxID=210 RepID=UPI0009920A53|nr:UTP--glucose-1-phosphate uridylyltransferase GalU [Helicobacter pylori]OOQ03976.1 UTP--glucose-1-phosphate uridylyltransferase [Helicobacter pylori]PDW99794.1 UTP--glucose-1-phosphate uridylyltransferase [Helicobacter pylori]QTO98954.1 UTP--glucose-1-phosphate uridylyltransferase GalU [Helicobacter pylori]QTP01855.1 UTP--glucose-1-phosphate uridylyltransferase GalU [Helicobacter pylori]WQU58749.1 UTP--glucose-1-phosphate uridylyltransferase GalU [Helicobacter pylori]